MKKKIVHKIDDKAVQLTNDEASISKRSASRAVKTKLKQKRIFLKKKHSLSLQGYFEDFYLRAFVRKALKRSALINRGYWIRVHAFRQLIRQFFASVEPDVCVQVLSLGAGYDSAPFHFLDAKHKSYYDECTENFKWFEIDFPDVVRTKASVLQSDKALQHLMTNEAIQLDLDNNDAVVVANGKRYCLLSGDLRQMPTVIELLEKQGFDKTIPTLVICE